MKFKLLAEISLNVYITVYHCNGLQNHQSRRFNCTDDKPNVLTDSSAILNWKIHYAFCFILTEQLNFSQMEKKEKEKSDHLETAGKMREALESQMQSHREAHSKQLADLRAEIDSKHERIEELNEYVLICSAIEFLALTPHMHLLYISMICFQTVILTEDNCLKKIIDNLHVLNVCWFSVVP